MDTDSNITQLNDKRIKDEADAILARESARFGNPVIPNPVDAAEKEHADEEEAAAKAEADKQIEMRAASSPPATWGQQKKGGALREIAGQAGPGFLADVANEAWDFASLMLSHGRHMAAFGLNPANDPEFRRMTEGTDAYKQLAAKADESAKAVETGYKETFGTDDNNIVAWPEPEHWYGQVARILPQFIMWQKAAEKGVLKAAELAPRAVSLIANDAAVVKYGGGIQKALNNHWFQRYASAGIADAVMTEDGGTMFNVINDAAEKSGYGNFVPDFLAAQEGDSMAVLRLRNMASGATFQGALDTILLSTKYGRIAYKAGLNRPEVVEALLSGKKLMDRLKPGSAKRKLIDDILREQDNLPIVQDVNGVDRVLSDSPGGVSYQDASTRLPEEPAIQPPPIPPMGPIAPDILEATTRQGEAVSPTGPGNVAAREVAADVFDNAQTQGYIRSEDNPQVRAIVAQAYRDGGISQASILLRRYSKNFWAGVRDAYIKAGNPLSRGEIKFAKTLLDNEAINFAKVTNLEPEAYYWYRFSNNSYDAIRVIEDTPGFSRSMKLPPGMAEQSRIPSKMVFGYDGHPTAPLTPGESKSARFYEFDGKGNATRVDHTAGPTAVDGPGMIDVSKPYHVYAQENGQEAARKLVVTLSDAADAQVKGAGSISKTMEKFGISREEAIDAIVTGVARDKPNGHALQFIHDDYDAAVEGILKQSGDSKQLFSDSLHKPLLSLGIDGVERPMGLGSFVREWFNDSGRDVKVVKHLREEGATHSSFPISADEAKATLTEAEQEAADALVKASQASSRLNQSKVIDEEVNKFLSTPSAQGVYQKIDELLTQKYGPSEYIPVTRSHGPSNAGSPDGEFVAVTTNPSATGEKLWVRRSDLVAPTDDGFFARTANVIPDEEFGNATHFEQAGRNLLPKGAIDFARDGRALITLFSGRADFSTLMHETGHLFFRDLEFQPEFFVPRHSLSEWLGVNPRIPYDRWPAEAQEKWAKGFENYIATGDAPVGMDGLMKSARKWMTQVYGGLLRSELGPKLNPEIEAFMGRIISGTVKEGVPKFPFGMFNEGNTLINYDRVDAEDQVMGIMEHFRKADVGIVDAVSGKVMKFADISAEAERLNRSVNDLLDMPKHMDPHDAYALRCFNVSSAATVDRLADIAIASGDLADQVRVQKAIALHRVINIRESIESRAASRGLGARRMPATVQEDMVKEVMRVIDEMTGDQMKDVTTYIKGFDGDPVKIAKFLDGFDGPSFMDVIHENFLNAALSGPGTQVKNIVGNASSIIRILTTTYATAKVNKALGIAGYDAVDKGSVDAIVHGFLRGISEGRQLAKLMYRDDWFDPSYAKKYGGKAGHAFTSEGFRPRWGDKVFYEGDMGLIGDMIDWVGANVVRQPTRMVRSVDGFSKSIVYRMELHTRAYRAAQDEAKRIAAQTGKQATPDDIKSFMGQWLSKPPREDVKAARKAAMDESYQSEFNTKIGRDLASMASKSGLRKIFTFAKVGANLAKAGVREYTPAGIASSNFRARLFNKDPRIAQLARTQYAAVWWAYLALGDAYDRGVATLDYKQGKENINERQSQARTGIPESSFALNGPEGPMASFKGIDPPGFAASMMLRSWEIMDRLDDQTATDLATALVVAGAETFSNRSSLEGMQKLIDVVQNPELHTPEAMTESAKTYIGEMVASHIIPAKALVSTVERTIDPTTRSAVISPEDEIAKMRQDWAPVERILNEAYKNIPGLSETMPANIDLYGDEMSNPLNSIPTWYGRAFNMINPMPIGYAKKENAQFEAMFARNNFFPEKPARELVVAGQTVYLKTAEYEQYSRKSGQYLREYLTKMMPKLEKMPDGEGKVRLLQDIIAVSRKRARVDMFGKESGNTEELVTRIEASKQKKQSEIGTRSWGLTSEVTKSIAK